ncbi:MAG: VCBS repeat-containing protein [Vicinamibacterales bacterium]
MKITRTAISLLSLIVLFDRPALAQAPTFSRIDTATTLTLSGGLTLGDFNGDRFPDLVLQTHTIAEPLGLYFLRGHGDGTFAAPVQVFSGCCASVANGDINGDGKLDLVVGSLGEEWVLLGKGDGSFGDVHRSAAPPSPRAPLVLDFNRDGKLDLALAVQDGGVSILLGKSDGTFATATNFPIGGGGQTNAIVAGDFNADGVLDIAASNPGPPDFTGSNVSVLLGNGDGTFGPPTDFTVGTNPFPLVTADLDQNGKLDLAVANYQAASLSVLLGNGDGTFAPRLDALNGPYPVGLGAADFNGDYKPDLAIGGATPSLEVVLGNGDGTMGPVNSFAALRAAQHLGVADFNLDGKPDVVILYLPPTSVFSVFLNTTIPDTTPPDTTPPVVTASASPSTLWPASGRTVPVTISGTITDMGSGVDPSSARFQVTDEYGIVHPSGSIVVNQDGSYRVRIWLTASRQGSDRDGRTYTITVSAKDKAGNLGSGKTEVHVPHDAAHVGTTARTAKAPHRQ